MRKFIFILFILILGTAGYFIVYKPNQLLPSLLVANSPSVSLNPLTKTYSNSRYSFQFSYPNTFLSSPTTVHFLKTPIIQFSFKAGNYPKTNLVNYDFAVSTDSNVSNCNWGIEGGANAGNPLRNKLSVNGILFFRDSIASVGPINFYESRIYRTVHDLQCFEVVMTIHATNIGDYPVEYKIKEVDKNAVWIELEQILNSFKFTK